MDEFDKVVKDARKVKKYRIIHNASKSHALTLFKNLLEEAKETHEDIKIVTGSLDAEFYGQLTDNLRKCLDAGVKCEVIVAKEIDIASNEFAKLLDSHEHGNIYMGSMEPVQAPHFIVVGNNKYRFEVDDETSKAIANFNDDAVGSTLVGVFSTLRDSYKKPSQG